jgi:hypothetical protein
LQINDLPVHELLSKAIDKMMTLPRESQDYREAFHCINVLISLMPDTDPNKSFLIKKLFSIGRKQSHTSPLRNPTHPLRMG